MTSRKLLVQTASSNNLSLSTIAIGAKAFHKFNCRVPPILFGSILPHFARSVTNMADVGVNADTHKQPTASIGNLNDPNEPKPGVAEISNGLPPLVMQIIVRRDLLNVSNTTLRNVSSSGSSEMSSVMQLG